jgi:hypothetical protein
MIAVNIKHPTDDPYTPRMSNLLIGEKLAQQGERLIIKKNKDQSPISYEGKDLDALVDAHRHSFEIPYSVISATEIERGFLKARLNIDIVTPAEEQRKIIFKFSKKMISTVENLLDTAFPQR